MADEQDTREDAPKSEDTRIAPGSEAKPQYAQANATGSAGAGNSKRPIIYGVLAVAFIALIVVSIVALVGGGNSGGSASSKAASSSVSSTASVKSSSAAPSSSASSSSARASSSASSAAPAAQSTATQDSSSGGAATQNSGASPAAPSPQAEPSTMNVRVTIDSSAADSSVSADITTSVPAGASVYDALVTACDQAGISVNARNTQYGIYVAAIGGLAEMDSRFSGTTGWRYGVNSTDYIGTACSNYTVHDGDTIMWWYTTNG